MPSGLPLRPGAARNRGGGRLRTSIRTLSLPTNANFMAHENSRNINHRYVYLKSIPVTKTLPPSSSPPPRFPSRFFTPYYVQVTLPPLNTSGWIISAL